MRNNNKIYALRWRLDDLKKNTNEK